MRWFGKKAGRATVRPALARGFSTGLAGGEWPRAYDAQVREAYARNPVAQRAVRLVAESVGEAPLIASEPAAAGLLGSQSGGQGLVEMVAAQLLLHGNAYVQILTDAEDRPVELYALRPERVTVEADARGWPTTYVYRVGETAQRLDAAGLRPQLVHLKTFHPLDDHQGLGCLGAAAGAVAIHNAATRWNKSLLDNAARPSGALLHDPGPDGVPLTVEQFERLRGELDELFTGAGNAGRPMLLEGGLRWQSLSLPPADMDFVGVIILPVPTSKQAAWLLKVKLATVCKHGY